MTQETPFQDPFELLKKMWGPMGLPLAPLLDLNDIEKRIADLKSVETWLSMNMNVLRMTIQLMRNVRRAIDPEWDLHANLRVAIDALNRDEVDARRQLELG